MGKNSDILPKTVSESNQYSCLLIYVKITVVLLLYFTYGFSLKANSNNSIINKSYYLSSC